MLQSLSFRLVALVCVIASAMACNRPALLLEANHNNLQIARTVAAAFYQLYGKQYGLDDVPFVTLGMESGQGYSYDVAHNVLFITPFEQADFDTQKIFARAAAEDRAAETYNDIMFRFFTAHQLLHLVYDQLPLTEASQYDEETRINTLTWLFLEEANLLSPNEQELGTLYTNLKQNLEKRFPTVARGKHHAADLVVDDNASYWYVTATSLLESKRFASGTGSSATYLAGLVGKPNSTAAAAE